MTASVEAKAPRDTGYIGLGEALSWVGWRHSIGNIELHNAIAAGELGEDADQALAAALNDLMAHATASRVTLLGKVARSHGDVDTETIPIESFKLVDFQRYEIVRDALWRGKGLVWFPTPFDLIFDDVPGYSEVMVDRSTLMGVYPEGSASQASESKIPFITSGAGGRPTAKPAIQMIYNERLEAGLRLEKVTDEAAAIGDCYQRDPRFQPHWPSVTDKSIKNTITRLHQKWKAERPI